MIRVVLAVLLTVATVAAALPAVEDARRTRTADVVESDAERIVRAARALVRGDDATAPGVPGAQRVLALRVPRANWHTAGVERVTISPASGAERGGRSRAAARAATLSYHLEDESVETVRLAVGDARIETPGDALVFGPGRHRVRLRLVAADDLAVVVERA